MTTETPPLHLKTDIGVVFAEFKPDHSIKFFRDQEQVGCFNFSTSPATFTGDVDESARLFTEAVLRMWPQIKIQND